LEAFYFTTIFLTLLPVVMLFAIGYWLYSKHRKT
jgi:lipopolysaccharide export LptBFGC system permease protein LptF